MSIAAVEGAHCDVVHNVTAQDCGGEFFIEEMSKFLEEEEKSIAGESREIGE